MLEDIIVDFITVFNVYKRWFFKSIQNGSIFEEVIAERIRMGDLVPLSDNLNSRAKEIANYNFKIIVLNPNPVVTFDVNDATINKGSQVTFNIDVTTQLYTEIKYILQPGDGGQAFTSVDPEITTHLHEQLYYIYDSPGNYNALLIVTIDGINYDYSIPITVNQITTQNPPFFSLFLKEKILDINNPECLMSSFFFMMVRFIRLI